MKQQFYGIKYPISEESDSLTFFDMNETKEDSITSMLLHIIFTPKGQRLRRPTFGTDLIRFIFEPNNSGTWDGIKNEIREQVQMYLPQVMVDDLKIIHNTNEENSIYVQVEYSVKDSDYIIENKVVVKI